ncbi:MAG: fluoride efflux transporter CrcB [Gemmatimonadaceae bacterium]
MRLHAGDAGVGGRVTAVSNLNYLASIGLGSAFGGVTRAVVGGFVQNRSHGVFPWGTLLVNISGSFLIGLILGDGSLPRNLPPTTRALLASGFCGGYTTFSAFSYESIALVSGGFYGRAVIYSVSSVAAALTATVSGISVARALGLAWTAR